MRHSTVVFLLATLSLLVSAACSDETTPDTDAGPDPTDSGAVDGGALDGGPDAGPSDAVTIFQIQDATRADHVSAGATVSVVGAVVTAVDAFEERGEGMGHVGDVWIADPAGGPFSGVQVYMPEPVACAGHEALRPGDVVTVTGTLQEFAVPSDESGRTVTQVVGSRAICTAAGDGIGPAARRIDDPASLLDDATAAQWEGALLELVDVEATADPDLFGVQTLLEAPALAADLHRHEGSIRDRFDAVRGIFHYMFGRYALYPRASGDVVLNATPRVLETDGGGWGCADGEDNEADGDVDCDDRDCAVSRFCRGETWAVQDLQDASRATRPTVEDEVTLQGPLVVTAVDAFEEIAGVAYRGTVVVQDPDAAADPRFSGVHVFLPPRVEACAGDALVVGDRVYVAGVYREFASEVGGETLTEIANGTVSCREAGAPLTPHVVADIADLGPTAAEAWEGVLVEIGGALRVSTPPGEFGRFQVTDTAAGDPAGRVVSVDDDLYRVPGVTAATVFTRLAGVLTQQNEYQLEPRAATDVAPLP